MKTKLLFPIILILLLVCPVLPLTGQQATKGWKAGISRIKITPQESMWMAGYGARDHPSEGTLHDLWAKALAIEDSKGQRAVLITTDLAGTRKFYSDRLRGRIRSAYNLSDAQVLLNYSHTHSGPVISGAPEDTPKKARESGTGQYSPEQQAKIDKYSEWLDNEIVKLVGAALKSMQPVKIYTGIGVARFAVNRRTNAEAVTRDGSVQLAGPVDHSVPVLKIAKPDGSLAAVIFGYACHNTVLNIYKWSGDYAGFAQIELEKLHPGATAMFFAGTGADQNPLPRRTVALAQQYGNTLASSVERVLADPMNELDPVLFTGYSEANLQFKQALKDPARKGENERISAYPYPVHLWRIGSQNIVALGGEVVVDYALRLKQILGRDLFVMAYSTAIMGYIPSERVLREGGYEGERVHVYLGDNELPSVWTATVESSIINEVLRLAEKAGISVQ